MVILNKLVVVVVVVVLQYFDWPIPVFIRFIKANHEFTEK